MPNWVTNKITFDAAKADEVFAAVKSEHSVFDFERLVPSPPNMYHGNLSGADSEDFKVNWSNWCPENWGTKWNACRPTVGFDEGKAFIKFETAWAVPYGVIAAFCTRFRIPFELRYFDEAPNFWGVDEFGTDKHDPDERISRISRRRSDEKDRRALGLELTGRDYDADEE